VPYLRTSPAGALRHHRPVPNPAGALRRHRGTRAGALRHRRDTRAGVSPVGARPPRKKGHGCLIAFLIVVGLFVVLVAGCTWLIAPIVGTEVKLTQDLGPRATRVDFNWNNGSTSFVIHLAPGYEGQAERITCQIVKPDIQTSSTPNARFQVVSSGGYILADETTPCG
jgi:hypothetical protein